MRRILLVEPDYKNKYPPLGLMKISTYHKKIGDEVFFVKGIDPLIDDKIWDRIYVTTLFTFYFKISVDTINHYKSLVVNAKDLYVGGILASLMPDKIMQATGLKRRNILIGTFTNSKVLGDGHQINIDQLPLDYDILEDINYKYPAGDNYFAYITRGCPNHCSFCAVPILEPTFYVNNKIIKQIKNINRKFGPKRNLLLLDNNILNAPHLSLIVDDLCKVGFHKDAVFYDPGDYEIIMKRYHNNDRAQFLDSRMKTFLNKIKSRIRQKEILEIFINILIESESAEDYAEFMLEKEHFIRPIVEKYYKPSARKRYLDFNQGIDARKINDDNMTQLSRLAIKPLRIAFDDVKLKDTYINAIKTAHRHGIIQMSNYILFNYKDSPADLYERLEINIKLNQELGLNIFSFPMRYSPINKTDRNYVGEQWNTKYLRAVSAILQVTKGVVAAGEQFFYIAFGKDINEFYEILAMPREFIMFRKYYRDNGLAEKWKQEYYRLSEQQRIKLLDFTSLTISELKNSVWPSEFVSILTYYLLKYPSESD